LRLSLFRSVSGSLYEPQEYPGSDYSYDDVSEVDVVGGESDFVCDSGTSRTCSH